MDLLKYRNEKDKKNQDLIKEILNSDLVQRYCFGSLAEMSLIRELMLDKIMKGKINDQSDLQKYDNIKESLKEYFYVEKLEQLDTNDYVRYLTFTKINNEKENQKENKNKKENDIIEEFELKKGGFFVNIKDGFIILKNSISMPKDKTTYWKISDKTPLFCKLDDNDKMILVLMEVRTTDKEK
jgi:hypothetical protein